MKLKICGMKYKDNLLEVASLMPDYLGFIFYKSSKRYMNETLDPEVVNQLPATIQRVGVFVDESTEEILKQTKRYGLKLVQLHGNETPEQCAELRATGLKVIKVFGVGEDFDFNLLVPYREVVDYFLFDTKSPEHGGTGKRFNWDVLKNYKETIPLFLSGGIGPEHIEEIKKLTIPIFALDVNSRFEVEPGRKNIGILKELVYTLGVRR